MTWSMNKGTRACRTAVLLAALLIGGLVFAGTPQAVYGKTVIKAPSKVSYELGSKGKLKATVSPKKGIKLKYTSSAKKVLTINSKGKYKAKALGTAKVTIKAVKGSKVVAKKKVSVTVKRIKPDLGDQEMALHTGTASKDWTPYYDYPDIQPLYTSSDPALATVGSDGTIRSLAPGQVTITAASPKTDKYEAAESKLSLTVLSDSDGLYLIDQMPDSYHFYYKGKKYGPGDLGPEIERELCLTQPDLKVYLEEYLAKYREKISDPTEAALTAIINYGARYMRTEEVDPYGSRNMGKDHFIFDSALVGTLEDSKDIWMTLIDTRKGACVYYSNLFAYLCYLSDIPAMQLEDGIHDWNLIYHDGYYYNLDNYYLLCGQEDGFVAPPLTADAARIFKNKIIKDTYVLPSVPGTGPGQMPVTDIGQMGADLSQKCPLLLYERTGETKTEAKAGSSEIPEYRVFFSELEKGHIPEVRRQGAKKPITLDQLIYRNMEADAGDDEVAIAFAEASEQLQKEVGDLLRPEPFNTFIEEVNEFGNMVLNMNKEEFEAAGYRLGDIVHFEFGDHSFDVPYCNNPSDVAFQKEALSDNVRFGRLCIIINGGSSAEKYGLPTGQMDIPVTITMKTQGGYLDHMEKIQVPDYSKSREDYSSDQEFANFRMIKTTGMRENVLYRSASPINPDYGRNTYADRLLDETGVKTVVNMADTPEKAAGYEGYDESYYKRETNHIEVRMGVSYGTADFDGKLKQGLEHILNHPGPYAIHCTVGKDRTGFVAGVLECLTGASYKEITDDYMKTFYWFYKDIKKDDERDALIIKDNIVSELEYVLEVPDLKTADRQAAAEKYLLKCGLTEEQLGQLEKLLCEPMTVKTKKVTVKYGSLKKQKQVISGSKAFTVKYARDPVSFKKVKGNKKITVAGNGKVTIKKGLNKGTYKVKTEVTASGGYMGEQRQEATLTVRVK